jgi:hypothetical protein
MSKIIIYLLIASLVGCAGTKTQNSSSTSSKNSDMAIGEKLALLDGKKEPSEIKIYSDEFKKLQNLCLEDNETLGAMVFGIAKKGKEAGYKWSTNLDTLKSFVEMAESGFERKPAQCTQIYSMLSKDYEDE